MSDQIEECITNFKKAHPSMKEIPRLQLMIDDYADLLVSRALLIVGGSTHASMDVRDITKEIRILRGAIERILIDGCLCASLVRKDDGRIEHPAE